MVLIIHISGWKTVFHAPRHHRWSRRRDCSIPPFRIRDQDRASSNFSTIGHDTPIRIARFHPVAISHQSRYRPLLPNRLCRADSIDTISPPPLVRSARLNLIRRLLLDGSRTTSIYHPGKIWTVREIRGEGEGPWFSSELINRSVKSIEIIYARKWDGIDYFLLGAGRIYE